MESLHFPPGFYPNNSTLNPLKRIEILLDQGKEKKQQAISLLFSRDTRPSATLYFLTILIYYTYIVVRSE